MPGDSGRRAGHVQLPQVHLQPSDVLVLMWLGPLCLGPMWLGPMWLVEQDRPEQAPRPLPLVWPSLQAPPRVPF